MAQPRPRRFAARADFASDQAEQCRDEQRRSEKRPEYRFGDEDEAAGVPARIEGKERSQAIVVRPVEQQVAQSCDEGREVKPAPADGLGLQALRDGRAGFEMSCRQPGSATALLPEMQQSNQAHNDRGDDRGANKRMRNAAMMLQLFNGPAKSPEYVHVGSFGCQHGGQRGVGRFAVQPGAANAGAGKKMRDGFHSGLQLILTCKRSLL